MKVVLSNPYRCSITLCNENDGIYDAPTTFEDINAALAYCEEEIDVRQQAISAVIWDTNTGEIYATCGEDKEDFEDWDIDEADLEIGFNPYMGGYDYDC